MESKSGRSAPPPLQAGNQSKPSLTNTKPLSVVDSAMKGSGIPNTPATVATVPTGSSRGSARIRQQQSSNIGGTTSSSSSNPFAGNSTMQNLLWVLGISCIISSIVNIIHVQRIPVYGTTNAISVRLDFFKEGYQALQESNEIAMEQQQRRDEGESSNDRYKEDVSHEGGGNSGETMKPHYETLNCDRFGGPSLDAAQEMVYWKDIAADQKFVSPFKAKAGTSNDRKLYMTFEPDGGGWNNIRMAMETVLALAVMTGRILVLPAEQRMYLLQKNRGKQKTDFSFMDFFPMKELSKENAALTTITMEEFLKAEAMTGHMVDKTTGKVSFPPFNRTNWNGQDVKALKEWLRNVTVTPLWDPDSCLAAFPASGEHKDSLALQQMHQQLLGQGRIPVMDKPLPIDASPMERMKEMIANRNDMCLYDEEMQNAPVLHFMCYHKMHVRMLTHFYTFIYLENYQDDLWMKRFIRDHVRYIDEIQCAAARVVQAMRDYVRSKDPSNKDGIFDTFHIRRGDFQYKSTRIEATEIYNNVKDILKDGSIVYIATDERDKSFFDPLRKHYDIKFLDDFMPVLEKVNHNYFGMIDQLTASRGRLFFGCWFSTFTGYIMRIRGYHSTKDKLPGYEDGLLQNSYYYVTKDRQLVMHKYTPIQQGFFTREFPTSWRGIDYGVE